MTNISPRLKIMRLEITGKRGCVVPFEDGVNIIRGTNSRGKTTVLKLIHYAFGADGHDLIKEIGDCDYLLLDLELNGKRYRIRRHLQQRTARIQVLPFGDFGVDPHSYYEYQPGRDFSDFLLRSLAMPVNEIPKGRLAGETRVVSFLEILRLMYVPQDSGYSRIQADQRDERMKRAVFETVLSLSGVMLFDLEVEQSKLQARENGVKLDIDSIKRLIQEVGVPTKSEIGQRLEYLQDTRQTRLQELAEIKQRLREAPEWALDIREGIIQLDNEIQKTAEHLQLLAQTTDQYRLSRNDASNEQERLRRLEVSVWCLVLFSFTQCPRCIQPVTEDMRAREEQKHCMLCGRSIQFDMGPHLDISKRLNDLRDEVSELDELIANYESAIRTAREQIERLQRNKATKEQDLDERMGKHYTTAFVADVEFASGQIGALQEEANRWHDFESIWSKLDTRYASLEGIQAQVTSISAKLAELRENKAQDMQKLSTLESYLNEFLRGVFRGYQFSKIDDKSYEPVVNGQSYKRYSDVQRDETILAYYFALLKYSLHHDSNYPRFLMIDTPNKDDLDPVLYTQLMHNFGTLRQETEPFQLIIATRDVPADLQDNVILNLEEDYLLRDIQLRMFE